jgi:hypothetical protein
MPSTNLLGTQKSDPIEYGKLRTNFSWFRR